MNGIYSIHFVAVPHAARAGLSFHDKPHIICFRQKAPLMAIFFADMRDAQAVRAIIFSEGSSYEDFQYSSIQLFGRGCYNATIRK